MIARALAATLLAGVALSACATTSAPSSPDGVGYGAVVPDVPLSALACEPLAWCVAAGANPTASTRAASVEVSAGGQGRWAPASTPPLTGATFAAAACWASGCLVGGSGPTGSLLLLVNPARKASSLTSSHPPGTGVLALACTGPGRCLALVGSPAATAVFATTNSGASWRERASLPAALPVATAVACANAADCVAAGTGTEGAVVARTVDGGARWSLGALPHGYASVTSMTCSSPRWCMATARRTDGTTELLASRDGGRAFSVTATRVPTPEAVTCASIPTCAVGGAGSSGGAISVDVRTPHERLLNLSYVPDPVIAVACATPTKCTAITSASTVSFVG